MDIHRMSSPKQNQMGPATESMHHSEHKNLEHQIGNPVFSQTFKTIIDETQNKSNADEQNKEQSWDIEQNLLYKTSSADIGKYPARASNMPVRHHGKNQKFSEDQIKTGPPRHNGFNTSTDKSRTMSIDAYSTTYVKRL